MCRVLFQNTKQIGKPFLKYPMYILGQNDIVRTLFTSETVGKHIDSCSASMRNSPEMRSRPFVCSLENRRIS